MKHILLSLLLMGFSFTSAFGQDEPMDGDKLEAAIREVIPEGVVRNGNVIEFQLEDKPLYCIFDERHDRMRIISPIRRYSDVTDEQRDIMMKANFHSALDARYAVSDDVLYAAYIHPLSPLQESQIISAIYQVLSLNLSFGKQYTSGLLTYGGPQQEDTESI